MLMRDCSHQGKNNESSHCAQPEELTAVSDYSAGTLGPSSLEKTAVWSVGGPLVMLPMDFVGLTGAVGIPHTAEVSPG